MSPTALTDIARYADEYLQIARIEDWPNALNGVQIQNSGRVRKIGAAVDACTRSLRAAAERGIDFLIVHHGIFWPGLQAITSAHYRQVKCAFEADIAVYSSHLPLDLHPVVGNNAQLARALGLENARAFLQKKGRPMGVEAAMGIDLVELTSRLQHSLGGEVRCFAHGPERTARIALVTGAAGSEIYEVARQGIDTFITGEAPHWAAVAAQELGLNLLLGGHYATETFGVKALAAHLSDRFDLPWEFIDLPTGL